MKKLYLLFTSSFAFIFLFAQNPKLLKDVYPGSAGSSIQEIVKTTNYTFFNAEDDDPDTDRGLFRTDGTAAGTIKLSLSYPTFISSKADKLTAVGDKVFFAGDNFPGYGEIWVSDGTQAGTIALERFQPTLANKAPVVEIAKYGNEAIFSIVNSANRTILKKSNGTAAGTTVVFDFSTLFAGTPAVVFFKEVNGLLYFIVYDSGGTGSDQLWCTDGTTAGTLLVKDFGTSQYLASNIMVAGNTMYLMLVTPGVGDVLWKSDGTLAGTLAIKTMSTATSLNNYPQFAAINSTLFFSGNDGINGKELWKTDGTTAGTVLVANINPGAASSDPSSLINFNGVLHYAANNGSLGKELCRSSATGTGTLVIKDINPGSAGSNISNIVVSNNTLLLQADNGSAGAELWISDGTTNNTRQVADINTAGSSSPNLITSGTQVYFTANNGTNGGELFKYDNSGGVTTGITFETLYVNDNSSTGDRFTTAIGNDANPGTPEAPLATITQAIAIAKNGYRIMVDAGTYTEQVIINKGLTLIGAGSALSTVVLPSTILLAAQGMSEFGVIQTASNIDDVTIQDFAIDGKNIGTSGPIWGILSQTGGSIFRCEIKNIANNGVFVRYTGAAPRSVNVSNNYIHHFNYIGIDIQGTQLTAFSNNNKIDGTGGPYIMAYFLGGEFGPLANAIIFNNDIPFYNGWGIKINSTQATVVQNSLTGTAQAIVNEGAGLVNGTCNWYGTTDKTIIASKITGNVNYSPWLINGTDADVASVGFQMMPGACIANANEYYVNDNSQVGDRFTTAVGSDGNPGTKGAPFATISQAYAIAPVGSKIYVDAGNFDLGGIFYTFDKAMTFWGPNFDKSPNNASDKRQYNSDRNGEANLSNFEALINGSYVTFEGFTFNAGNRTAFRLFDAFNTNSNFGNVQFKKNVFKINGTGTSIHITGKTVTSPGMPVTFGFTIDDNRIEKSGTGSSTTFLFEYVKNVIVNNNAFVVTGSTFRTQLAMNFGGGGIVDAVTVTNNLIEHASTAINGPRLVTATIAGNTIDNSNTVLNIASNMSEGTDISFRNNSMINTTGGTPFIGYNRSGSSLAGTANKLLLENNVINGNIPTGSVNQFAAFLNLSINNTVLGQSVIIRGNTLQYTGDFSQSMSHLNRPITVRGNIAAVTIEHNEFKYTGGVMLPYVATSGLPENPAITVITDYSNLGWLPSNAVVNIANNKIDGFKQSLVFYDQATAGRDSYIGFGNMPTGATVNVINNSFTNDSLSINNGTVGQVVSATCNWYGSSSNITAKLSANLMYTQWLVDGTDADVATGFQQTLNSCTGNAITFQADAKNITCFGLTNGTISVSLSNGQEPYSYVWIKEGDASFSANTKDLANLAAGAYKLTITDAIGSINDTTIIIEEPAVLTASLEATNITCNGAGNGKIVPQLLGGTLPYTYLWSNAATTDSLVNLAPGFYSVVITDSSGCTLEETATITEPDALQLLEIEKYDITCNGSNDGFIAVIVTGGTGNYSYLWSNGSTEAFIYELTAGTYSVMVTDEMGCSITENFTIAQPDVLLAAASGTGATITGASDGTLQLVIKGGTYPYEILWNDANTDSVRTGLPAGKYVATVYDYNGCADTASFTIEQPVSFNIQVTATAVNCFGGTDGTASVTTTEGTGPFTYLWSNGATTATINNLVAGKYSVTVTATNGFSITDIIEVVQPTTPVTIDLVSATAVSCFNGVNGIASVSASGGAGTYTYLWSNGATSATASGLAAGSYTIILTDANGCTADGQVEIIQPAVLTVATTGTNVLCNAGADGTVTAIAVGGVAPYSYTWSNGATGNAITGLPIGTYIVTITDANGCTITDNHTILQPPPVTLINDVVNVSCFGAGNGSLTVNGRGGTAPYQYSLNGSSFGTQNAWVNLSPATYTVMVKDANNCKFSTNITIAQPTLLVQTAVVTATCAGTSGGAINITVNGGTPKYTFNWSGPGGYTSTREDLIGLAAGTYTVTITDGNSCMLTNQITVSELPALTLTSEVNTVDCYGGLTGGINQTLSPAGAYSFSWSGPNGYKATTEDINSVKAGTYNVSITSSNGCTQNATYNVTQPAAALTTTTVKTDISNCGGKGSITATSSGGTAPYQYRLNAGAYQSVNGFSGLAMGTYTLTTRDSRGCVVSSAAISIIDNGSDAYESNEKQTAAASIIPNTVITARIAPSATDKDWFKFTTGGSLVTHTLTLSHPVVSYLFDVYDSRGRIITPASSTSGLNATKTYAALLPNTVYSIQVRGNLSYSCYQLQVSNASMITQVVSGIAVAPNKLDLSDISSDIKVLAYPNPTDRQFQVRVTTASNLPIGIRVMNNFGQVIEVLNVTSANKIIMLGANYRPGIYYIEIIQGSNRKSIKLIKQ